jgi:hypothetical protein
MTQADPLHAMNIPGGAPTTIPTKADIPFLHPIPIPGGDTRNFPTGENIMKMKIKETMASPPVADLLVPIRTVPQSPVAYLLMINYMNLHMTQHNLMFASTPSQPFQIKVASMLITHNKRSNNNSWQNAISCKIHGSLIQTVPQLSLIV